MAEHNLLKKLSIGIASLALICPLTLGSISDSTLANAKRRPRVHRVYRRYKRTRRTNRKTSRKNKNKRTRRIRRNRNQKINKNRQNTKRNKNKRNKRFKRNRKNNKRVNRRQIRNKFSKRRNLRKRNHKLNKRSYKKHGNNSQSSDSSYVNSVLHSMHINKSDLTYDMENANAQLLPDENQPKTRTRVDVQSVNTPVWFVRSHAELEKDRNPMRNWSQDQFNKYEKIIIKGYHDNETLSPTPTPTLGVWDNLARAYSEADPNAQQAVNVSDLTWNN